MLSDRGIIKKSCHIKKKTAIPDATGTRFRYRMMTRPALNGGKECPDILQVGKG
jgi:hypothetical protein